MNDSANAPGLEACVGNLFRRAETNAVRRHGFKRAWVRQTLAPKRSRIYVNADGAVRILAADDPGAFLPGTTADAIVSVLVKEVGDALEEEEAALMDLTEQHLEDLAQEQEAGQEAEGETPPVRAGYGL
jgi:hypothetical protein